jgi:hypothetical protein
MSLCVSALVAEGFTLLAHCPSSWLVPTNAQTTMFTINITADISPSLGRQIVLPRQRAST